MEGNLSDNEEVKDTILEGFPKTDVCWANLVIVLLLLFVLWKRFLDLFYTAGTIIAIYKKFAWNI